MRQPETSTTRRQTTSRQLSLDFVPDGKFSKRGRMLKLLKAIASHPCMARSTVIVNVLRAIDDTARNFSFADLTHHEIAVYVGSRSYRSMQSYIRRLRKLNLLTVERREERYISDPNRRAAESRDTETVYRFRIQWGVVVEVAEADETARRTADSATRLPAEATQLPTTSIPALKRLPPPPEHDAVGTADQLEREPREGEAEVVGRIRQKLDAPDGPLERIETGELPIDVAGRILDRAERESAGPGLLHTWLMKGTAEQSAADRAAGQSRDDPAAAITTIRDVRRRIHPAAPDAWRLITAAVDPDIADIVAQLGGWGAVRQMPDADLAADVRRIWRSRHLRRREVDP